MTHDTTLLSRLRKYGVPVVEIDGWQTRGKDLAPTMLGSVNHHTGGAVKGAIPSLNVLINGRSDLPGPLCNVGLGRDGVARLIAAGRANHAGTGSWHGHTGNSAHYGLEWEHSGGPNEPIPDHLVDVAARIHAAFADGHYHSSEVCQHWEWAPTRKVDYCKGRLSAAAFREKVSGYLTAGGYKPPADPAKEEWTMPAWPGYLRLGMHSEAVKTFKYLMVAAGFKRMNMVGDAALQFGVGTEADTKALQKLAGLEESGVVGPKTWNALHFILYLKYHAI